LATCQRRKQKKLRITLYFGDLLLNLLSKYGDLKNIKIKSLTPLDFSVFFGQKIPCMSSTGIFWSTSDENLPKKKKLYF
jgi:hypothetical protein